MGVQRVHPKIGHTTLHVRYIYHSCIPKHGIRLIERPRLNKPLVIEGVLHKVYSILSNNISYSIFIMDCDQGVANSTQPVAKFRWHKNKSSITA